MSGRNRPAPDRARSRDANDAAGEGVAAPELDEPSFHQREKKIMKRLKRLISILMIVSFTNVLFIQHAAATLISTEQVARAVAAEQGHSGHARLADALARADVQQELVRLGVSAEDAQLRIAALTDDEAARLAQQIESAPAGSGVLGAILLVFFVLLLTDILGFTKVFPFTRAVR